jgi:hypothetical protein
MIKLASESVIGESVHGTDPTGARCTLDPVSRANAHSPRLSSTFLNRLNPSEVSRRGVTCIVWERRGIRSAKG